MKQFYYVNQRAVIAFLMQQLCLQQQLTDAQQQLAEAQREIIKLQKQLGKMTPKTPKDKDVFWYLNSDGVSSLEAANSSDLVTVRQFKQWLVGFAQKQIRPYVNPKVYGEVINQLTRGLPEHITELETQKELRVLEKRSDPMMRFG